MYTFSTFFEYGLGDELPDSDMMADVNFAMTTTYDVGSLFQNQVVDCATGNCTFPKYQSLGIDHSCTTRQAGTSGSFFTHPANPLLTLRKGEGMINATIVSSFPKPGSFPVIGPLIARWLLLANANTTISAPVAVDCIFYYAVHTYESNVSSNYFYEDIVDRWSPATTKEVDAYNKLTLNPPTCWRNGSEVDSSDPDCMNTINAGSLRGLQNFFNLSDFAISGGARYYRDHTWGYSSIFMQSLLPKISNQNATAIFDAVNATSARISYMVSNYLRRAPVYLPGADEPIYARQNGTMLYAPIPYYHVRWVYILIPIGFVFSSIMFLVATLVITRNSRAWKTSTLAVLYHGLSSRDAAELGTIESYADMYAHADHVKVKFDSEAADKKLVSSETLLSAT